MKAKIILFLVVLLPFTYTAIASCPDGTPSSSISVSPIKTHRGDTATIVISLSNPEEIYNSFQMDLQLPEGVSLCNKRRSGYLYELSDRFSKNQPSVIIKEQEDGRFRILVYSFNLTSIMGKSGPLLTIPIISDAKMKKGKYHGMLTEIIFNQKDNKGTKMEDVDFIIKVK